MNEHNLLVYSNNDQAIIVWKYDEPIDNCIGFSIFKKLNNESDALAEPIMNKVGFEGEAHQPGEQRPSTEWPIQRFTWTDFGVSAGDVVNYKIVPILLINNQLVKDEANSSDWSETITIGTGSKYQAFFNRGIISSQFYTFMSREMANHGSVPSVKSIISGGSNKLRDFLGGYLSQKLFDILDDIAKNDMLEVYGALYELQQSDLIEKLKLIGPRAHIVLGNGSFKTKGQDMNEEARQGLRDEGVDVYDRIVDVGHFAHNKFLVISEGGIKKHVWTGSTNWTPGGLFSQVNNGLYIVNDERMANAYFNEWEKLRDAKNSSSDPDLISINSSALPDNNLPHVWFSPKSDTADLKEATKLLNNATKGILFLFFNPGVNGTLFNEILSLQDSKPDLFIHGVINQDLGGSNPLIFFHKGNMQKANWDDILPDKISHDFGFWDAESGAGLVTIHSKVIVIDPFTDHGYIITGSSNLGPKASLKNDDNLNILTDPKLVEEYAVNILAVYDHYRWRYSLSNADPSFKGLTKDPHWMDTYLNSGRAEELKNFWFK